MNKVFVRHDQIPLTRLLENALCDVSEDESNSETERYFWILFISRSILSRISSLTHYLLNDGKSEQAHCLDI